MNKKSNQIECSGASGCSTVLNYGGGRQTVAICVLIERDILPRPDKIIMANTGRENDSTWEYLATYTRPMLQGIGLDVEVIEPPEIPSLTYGTDDLPRIPVYTADGKLSPFCSGTWKRDRMASYLSSLKWPKGERWIGFSANEKKRINRMMQSSRDDGYTYRFPLAELMLTTADCMEIVRRRGWPEPSVSSCWMCPHKRNDEWTRVKQHEPDHWAAACRIDEELREDDLFRGGTGVWLHHSRVPLSDADLTTKEPIRLERQCSLGMCFV